MHAFCNVIIFKVTMSEGKSCLKVDILSLIQTKPHPSAHETFEKDLRAVFDETLKFDNHIDQMRLETIMFKHKTFFDKSL